MKRCVYAGSFDPMTFGHLWMVEQGSRMFDELIVAIGINPDKKYDFTLEERLTTLLTETKTFPNVRVASFENLYLVTYAKQVGADYILRGVRNEQDYSYERGMRYVNAELDPSIQTVFAIPPRQLCEVSSSFVKGLIGPRGWEHILPKYVPPEVESLFLVRYATARWAQTFVSLRIPTIRTPDARALVKLYQDPPRAYHNLKHILSCLSELDEVRSNAADPLVIELAIWFHDCVYDPNRNDNEEQSARVAEQILQPTGLPAELIARVQKLILATTHTISPTSIDEQLMSDIDLSILGQPPDIYDRYEKAIRQEYTYVDDNAFQDGRAKVLNHFLNRPAIYFSEVFATRYENSARNNLADELKKIQKSKIDDEIAKFARSDAQMSAVERNSYAQ